MGGDSLGLGAAQQARLKALGINLGGSFGDTQSFESSLAPAEQSIIGAQKSGALDLFSLSSGQTAAPATVGVGGTETPTNLAQVAQGIQDISAGIASLSAGRKSDRESKRARDIIASRARVEFKQRGVLARRLLARRDAGRD